MRVPLSNASGAVTGRGARLRDHLDVIGKPESWRSAAAAEGCIAVQLRQTSRRRRCSLERRTERVRTRMQKQEQEKKTRRTSNTKKYKSEIISYQPHRYP